VLHPVAELAEDILGHVGRVLRHEIDADPLGADQARHLFDLVDQRLGGVVEEKMRLVEEEDELGLVGIAHLRKGFEQLRQEPQQEGRVERGDCMSVLAARMLIRPNPAASVRNRSSSDSAGSPKSLSPPCPSSTRSRRWIAPIDAVETLP
jgi:hypothetical protein